MSDIDDEESDNIDYEDDEEELKVKKGKKVIKGK